MGESRQNGNVPSDMAEVMVFTDEAAYGSLSEHLSTDLAHAFLVPIAHGGTIDHDDARNWVKSGKRTVTWCSPTRDGASVAMKLSRHTSNLRHIIEADPTKWRGNPPFDELVAAASEKRPTRPSGGKRQRRGDIGTNAPSGTDIPYLRERYRTSPQAVAMRLLQERPNQILAVAANPADKRDDHPTAYALASTGIWDTTATIWTQWLFELAATMRDELRSSGIAGNAYNVADADIRRIERPLAVTEIRRAIMPEADKMAAEGNDPAQFGLLRCTHEDLDDEMRYLGAANGVIDLHTGLLLSSQAARQYLLTRHVPGNYDPERYPAADWFLSHLPQRERNWWIDAFGHALRGIPKRLYGCLAAPDSGKTTTINLLSRTLGPYCDSPTAGTLDAAQRLDGSSHTPGLFAWVSPVRITIVDEVKERELSAPLVKDLTGGGWIATRQMWERKVMRRATGTTFLFGNDSAGEDALPQLRTDDPGMKARYRELPFPAICRDQQNIDMRESWPDDPERRGQLLTLLVERAVGTPKEPEDIPEVMEKTTARLRKDAGELGAFAGRFIRDGSGVLPFSEAWAAWCEHNSESKNTHAPGGIRKRDFVRRLSAHIEGLVKPTPVRVKNRSFRAWRGWRLLTAEEADALERADVQERGRPPRPFMASLRRELKTWDRATIGHDGTERQPAAKGGQIFELMRTARDKGQDLPLLMKLLDAAEVDPCVTYLFEREARMPLVPRPIEIKTDEQVERDRKFWADTRQRLDDGDEIMSADSEHTSTWWKSDGEPASNNGVEDGARLPPEWSQTDMGRLLFMVSQYPSLAGAQGSEQFKDILRQLINEAALLLPEEQRAAWVDAAKADRHIAFYL